MCRDCPPGAGLKLEVVIVEFSTVFFSLPVFVKLAGGFARGQESGKANIIFSPGYYQHAVYNVSGFIFIIVARE